MSKKVYVVECYSYDSVTGAGDTSDIIEIHEDEKKAVEKMVSEFETRKADYVKDWLPTYAEELSITAFNEVRELDGGAPYRCEFVCSNPCEDGIGVRVLEFDLVA